jgi:hypothetical protein
VSTEVAEAVIDALQGKLSTTAVNAPLVSAEVLKELAPFVTLAEGLGKVRVGVVAAAYRQLYSSIVKYWQDGYRVNGAICDTGREPGQGEAGGCSSSSIRMVYP